MDFNALNNCYVIMICPFDLLGLGRYRYTFRMRCDEEPDVCLEDGGIRIFLNTRGANREEENPELIELLYYIEHATGESEIMFQSSRLERLHKRIQEIRNSKEVGVKYMHAWEERMLDRQEAMAEGKLLKVIEMIRNLQKKNMDATAIAELLNENDLAVKQIYQLITNHPDSSDEDIYNLYQQDISAAG